jgi:hypothetical protein
MRPQKARPYLFGAVKPSAQQSHGEHDLELAFSDGRRGLVEIAPVVDELYRSGEGRETRNRRQ